MTGPIEVEVAKAKVLAVYPNAFAVKSNGWLWTVYPDSSSGCLNGADDSSESEGSAWIDAASRLPARVEPAKHEFMPFRGGVCEKCGRERNNYKYHPEPSPELRSQYECESSMVEDLEAFASAGENVKRPTPQGGNYRPHYPKRAADAYMDTLESKCDAALKDNARLTEDVNDWRNKALDIAESRQKILAALALRDECLLQRERDLDHIRCQLMDANAKIADLEHQIRVIQMNSADNYAASENRTHKAEAERDEITEKVTALIAQLTPLIIPEAK